jgi:type III secretion protein T
MEHLPINELTDWVGRIFYSGFVGSARLMGLAIFFPLFSWLQLRGVLRNVIVIALSVPNIALIYFKLGSAPVPGTFEIMALVLKELAIGAGLGMLFGLPFWAAQVAGDVTDAFRGASIANLFDPVNANEVSLTGTFLTLYSLALFSLIGGIPLLADLVIRSLAVWPSTVLLMNINSVTLGSLAAIGGHALYVSLILAAPLLISLALADIALVFATRSGKSFPIYDLTYTFHNLIFIFILPAFALLFVEHFPPILRTMFTDIANILPQVIK